MSPRNVRIKSMQKKHFFVVVCGILTGALGTQFVQLPPSTLLAQDYTNHKIMAAKVEFRVAQLEIEVAKIRKEIMGMKED